MPGERKTLCARVERLVHRDNNGYPRVVQLLWLQLQVHTVLYLHDKCPWYPFIHCDLTQAGRSGGSDKGVGEIFRSRPDQPWSPTSFLYNGYRVFPGGKTAGGWC